MEALGMWFGVWISLAASAAYAGLAVHVFTRFRPLAFVLLWGSVLVVLLAFTEGALIWVAGGPISARGWIGPRFEWLHNLVFLLTPPAVANLIVFIPRPPLRDWRLVAGVTWLICVIFVFWNYDMSEKLYGPKGVGGPFSSEQP